MAPTRFPGTKVDPSPLAQSLHLPFSGKMAKNRFLKAAMSEHMATWDAKILSRRGIPTDQLSDVYRHWDEGGWGVILTGNIMVDYNELETIGAPVIPLDASFEGERFEKFEQLAAAGKRSGGLMIAQVCHPGRQVNEMINPNPISASDVQLEGLVFGQTFAKPRPMEEKDIKKLVEQFAHAAEFLHKAGFDGMQLHAAHGYLLSQFLSLTTNKRIDKYGGPLENRSRLIFEIASAIRDRVSDPSFSLSIKINSVEFQDGGFTLEDCKVLCRQLEAHAFDFVELSGGTYQQTAWTHHRDSTRRREAYFIEFAEAIIPELKKTKTFVTGGLRTVGAMVDALKTVDGVGIGRPATHEFDLPKKMIAGQVQGAIKILLDEQDYGPTGVAAGSQIRLVGEGKQPLDLSRQDHLNALLTSLGAWQGELAEDVERKMVGWCDVRGLQLQPYGSDYVAA